MKITVALSLPQAKALLVASETRYVYSDGAHERANALLRSAIVEAIHASAPKKVAGKRGKAK